MPPIHEEIADEAMKRDVTQGAVLEDALGSFTRNIESNGCHLTCARVAINCPVSVFLSSNE